ncbi:MAG: hypothetical protein AAF437_11040 [Pseudomonadota bacterium]
MTKTLSVRDLSSDTFSKTVRLIVPSLPFAGLFVSAVGVLVWAAGALPEGGTGFLIFALASLAALFAHSLFSAAMYRAVLVSDVGALRSAWTLTRAWILVMVVASIGVTIIVLFFSLIGASLGVASSETGQEITDMTAQMRAGGTFWPLFTLFIATLLGLFWFATRLMLFAAASAVRGQVHVFRAWFWTKGAFLRLAPLMLGFVGLPIAILMSVGRALLERPESPLETGVYAALMMLILLPSAWLGHGFAASVYARLAPEVQVDES